MGHALRDPASPETVVGSRRHRRCDELAAMKLMKVLATGRSQVSGDSAVITNDVVNGGITATVMANGGTFRVISFHYVLALDPA
jgi:hypothetical protein